MTGIAAQLELGQDQPCKASVYESRSFGFKFEFAGSEGFWHFNFLGPGV